MTKKKNIRRVVETAVMMGREPFRGADLIIRGKVKRLFIFGYDAVRVYQTFNRIPRWAPIMEVADYNNLVKQQFQEMRSANDNVYLEIPGSEIWWMKFRDENGWSRRRYFTETTAALMPMEYNLFLEAKETLEGNFRAWKDFRLTRVR